MPTYNAPIADFRFLLQEVMAYEASVASLPGLGDATMDLVCAVLEGADQFSREVLLPINRSGDAQRCRWTAEGVATPAGYSEAYAAYCEGGWPSLAGDPAFGGHGLPTSLALFVREVVASGSMAFGMYGGLSQGAYRAISAHGSEALKRSYLPRLIDGSWTGTMCLTEPESGSDLSRLRTRAVPTDDGAYRVSGSKIFISGGDHDLAENIVHLVLARLPDAPAGTKGISLFVVPKHVPDARTGAVDPAQRNGVVCTSIEHKMGIAASATASLSFEDSQGWLVGEPHGGLRAMFTMMNSSRVGVAVQSVGVAELSLQNARHYALDRRQGRAPTASGETSRATQADLIVMHPDVKKTLLTMKALVEGSRAMYVESAMALDVRARHEDASVRANADAALALMTPVLKSFISDCAVQVTRLGMSVFGGHGYIHENGMEQLLRDASIVPLYEGTNGIQALDLVLRKLNANGGAAVEQFLADVSASIGASGQHPDTAAMGVPLSRSLGHLREAAKAMQRFAADDPVAAAAGASDTLRLFGLVACGHAWLRMAIAAARADGGESAAFYSGKVKTARFYMTHLLPETEALRAAVCTHTAVIADLLPEEL
ncbi:MAG: acyl-CoA dehydrogenase [Rhizobacter sp.]|nr:acyl-CoA dehydrogenase [Rhizobacter sp.]